MADSPLLVPSGAAVPTSPTPSEADRLASGLETVQPQTVGIGTFRTRGAVSRLFSRLAAIAAIARMLMLGARQSECMCASALGARLSVRRTGALEACVHDRWAPIVAVHLHVVQ